MANQKKYEEGYTDGFIDGFIDGGRKKDNINSKDLFLLLGFSALAIFKFRKRAMFRTST